MIVAHEAPFSYMKDIRAVTNYDYALVHLFDKNPEYLEFFKESLIMGREVILDNSIFELGTAFKPDKFAVYIEELKPTFYIIPDVLENAEGTITSIRNWCDSYKGLPGKKIGVVQGKTYEEIVDCYKVVDQFCDVIAISFDYSYYVQSCSHSIQEYSWMYGRQHLIDRMCKDGVINYEKPHHLLGCGLPQEFTYYQHPFYKFLRSCDTSNPVVHGLKGIRYQKYGLERKDREKVNDLFSLPYDPKKFEDIMYNVLTFRSFL